MDIMEDMEKLEAPHTESPVLNKCGNMLDKLCSLKIRDSLDFKMSVIGKDENGSGEVEYCNKQIKDSSEYSLVRALGVAAAIGIGISLICSVCSLIKKL